MASGGPDGPAPGHAPPVRVLHPRGCLNDQALPGPLVSTAWLARHLGEPGLRVLDASWYLPQAGRDAGHEFTQGHIPGAAYFDLDAASDRDAPLPHMLPAADAFAAMVGGLGVSTGDRVVVYDGSGVNLSAARAWWMFRAFGHEAVAVLDGGLPLWRAEHRPLERGRPAPRPGVFRAALNPGMVRDLEAVRRASAGPGVQILDARSAGRFAGREPEPRPGLRGGHIPGSRNLPYTALTGPDGRFRPPGELRRLFEEAGIDLSRPVITTCGSGVTACVLALGLRLLDRDAAVYDGSWSEWGARTDTAVAGG